MVWKAIMTFLRKDKKGTDFDRFQKIFSLGVVHKLRLQDEVGRWLSKCQQMLTEVGRWSVLCKR